RRPRAGDLEFRCALQHHAHRVATSLLGKLDCSYVPAVGGKLASETSTNIVLTNVNIVRGKLDLFRHLSRDAGDVLRRDPHEQMIGVGPLRHGSVALKTAVSNH